MTQVTNKGTNPMVINTAKNRQVMVAPGATVDIPLKQVQVDRLNRTGFMQVSGGGAVPSTPVVRRAQPAAAGGEQDKRTALVKQLEDKDIGYHEFVAQAKELLGDEYPGGSPKRKDIIDALRGS